MNIILSTFSLKKLCTPLLLVLMTIYAVHTKIINEVRLNNEVNIYPVNCTYHFQQATLFTARVLSWMQT